MEAAGCRWRTLSLWSLPCLSGTCLAAVQAAAGEQWLPWKPTCSSKRGWSQCSGSTSSASAGSKLGARCPAAARQSAPSSQPGMLCVAEQASLAALPDLPYLPAVALWARSHGAGFAPALAQAAASRRATRSSLTLVRPGCSRQASQPRLQPACAAGAYQLFPLLCCLASP